MERCYGNTSDRRRDVVEIGCGVQWGSLFVFQAEDGIRDLVRSRGLGDVYKRQVISLAVLLDAIGEGLKSPVLDPADRTAACGDDALSLIHI